MVKLSKNFKMLNLKQIMVIVIINLKFQLIIRYFMAVNLRHFITKRSIIKYLIVKIIILKVIIKSTIIQFMVINFLRFIILMKIAIKIIVNLKMI